MASGLPDRDLRGGYGYAPGSTIQMPYQQRSDGVGAIGTGGLLKRSMKEMERQQQIQHALFLRTVKHKGQIASPSPISPLPILDLPSPSTTSISSILSSLSSSSAPLVVPKIPNTSSWLFSRAISASEAETEKRSSMSSRLLELERQLLDDDDEDQQINFFGSAVANCELSETMQKLISPSPLPLLSSTKHRSMSPSRTNTSSSSSGPSSSCLPSPSKPSLQMLLDTATAISEGNGETTSANLASLKHAANTRGDPEQRLTAMMVAALLSRINSQDPVCSLPTTDVCTAEHLSALHMLYEVSPCFKFGLMAANLAILEATKDHSKVHILDFDVGQGGQLAFLLNSIAERQRHPSTTRTAISLKITFVSDPNLLFMPNSTSGGNQLGTVGERLTKLAGRLGIGLQFNIVSRKIQELNRETLGCEPGEALAVNLAFILSRVADESVSPANPRDELLRRMKSLSPTIVTLVEQEINGNTAPFVTRFAEACAHYGPLLQSLDTTANRDSVERTRVETCLARMAVNSIAREGPERIERCELYGKWRARMGMAGLQPLPLGSTVIETVKLRLASIRNNPGFTVKEEAAWFGCGWMGRVLIVASAWR
ncbi:hypothetical protein HPP92_014102 [Vanilla planifolia]|uniref:Scarecrow-like protein 8 n=1 Tax=Vanilla planifolia TaxID=51239 RepID=A0A835UWJ8_VANPL|nr:hypothetical protein HPP92_014102 [Vanilla planifolia]